MLLLESIPALRPWADLLCDGQAGPILAVTELPFNPLRLLLLVAWFYLCAYFVQRTNYSPLVRVEYRVFANVAALLTGPLLLLILFIIDTANKSRRGQASFFGTLRAQLGHAISQIHIAHPQVEVEDSAIYLFDPSGRSLDEISGHGEEKRQDTKMLELTESIIANAIDRRASDILIDPKDAAVYTIRLRIDGVLRTVNEMNTEVARAVISSIKAVSGMDISERRRPQDGAFTARKSSATASFRAASAGVLHGEKLSIRILNANAGSFQLGDVGFSTRQEEAFRSAIRKPSGMILICGPTGSGKTTTMYALLNEIDRFTRNVITVEDPIEAPLPEASQIEINAKADITFAKTLRSVLRQDPDVICVGEIRDEETAEIALRAAQTGHLVLATLHSDSNATALIRLLDLGVSPLLISAGLNLVVSQRLVRRLCEHCRKPAELSDSQIAKLGARGIANPQVFEAVGCKYCEKTGYLGRTAICDMLVVDEAFKAEIARGKSLLAKLRAEGNRKGTSNLRREGLRLIVAGVTTKEELKRVVG